MLLVHMSDGCWNKELVVSLNEWRSWNVTRETDQLTLWPAAQVSFYFEKQLFSFDLADSTEAVNFSKDINRHEHEFNFWWFYCRSFLLCMKVEGGALSILTSPRSADVWLFISVRPPTPSCSSAALWGDFCGLEGDDGVTHVTFNTTASSVINDTNVRLWHLKDT